MGKTIHSESRNLILKVLKFFESEKANKQYTIPVDQVVKRTCAATGISKRTLMKIKNEAKVQPPTSPGASPTPSTSNNLETHPEPKLSTPGKKRKQYKKRIEVDDFDICAIRNIINSFYAVKKEIPTLKKILAAVKRDLNFQGGRTYLRNILINKLGYKFKKCKNIRCVLTQKPDIAAWRARYLRRMKENNDLGADKKPVTYLDETWIHSHYTVSKCWQNNTDSSVKKNLNPGQRWILVHAGGENGFIEGAELLYKCKSKIGDYHDEMDTSNFLKWLREKLIPNLPPNGIVVIDNAPYHSTQSVKAPTSAALKADMQNWLREHNIPFNDKMTKRELYPIILRTKPPKKYVVDDLMREHGHEVVRLPPYHCDLNPIEYIWNLVKQRVADKNIDQSEKKIEQLTKDAIKSITPADWKKEVNHVERLQREYWEKDHLADDNITHFLIPLGEDSSESSESESEEDTMSGIESIIYSD